MANISLNINGRTYSISCDDGQEARVHQLGLYVDSRLREIAGQGAAGNNESHLLVLTSLMMADEIMELRETLNDVGGQIDHAHSARQEELEIVQIIDILADKIDGITDRIQKV